MVEVPIIYVLFVSSIILQVITLLLLGARLKSIEQLIREKNIEIMNLKYLSSKNESIVETPSSTIENSNTTVEPVNTKDNYKIVEEKQADEDILFIKEIKLDRRSKVIDMDVQVNKKNK